MNYSNLFRDTGSELETSDGKKVKVVDFVEQDAAVLNEWGALFRKHYISDEDLDGARTPMGLSRGDFMKDIKFPSLPQFRSSDFSELLVADYIEFLMNFKVPRTRYDRKINRNSSSQGVDIVGFRLVSPEATVNDVLITCEVKASLGNRLNNNLQEAIDDSKKDYQVRLPLALNAISQRLRDKGDVESVRLVERFQNKNARPYKEITGAVFVCSGGCWDESSVTASNTTGHPNPELYMMVVKGNSLMEFANKLYEIAYATA